MMSIPESLEKVTFNKTGAPDLQQAKPLSKQPMCKHMGDTDSCEGGDAGAVKSGFFNRFRYKFFFVGVFSFVISAECSASFLVGNDNGKTIDVVSTTHGPLEVLSSTVFGFGKDNPETKQISHPERTVITIPLISINNFDQAVVAWQSWDLTHSRCYVEVAGYVEEKGWSPPKIISTEFEEVEPASARLHFSESGHVSVFWNIVADSKRLRRENIIFEIGDLFDSEAGF